MEPQAWITLAVVVLLIIVLSREMVAPSLAMFGATMVLFLSGIITADEALAGFSNEAPFIIAALIVTIIAGVPQGAVRQETTAPDVEHTIWLRSAASQWDHAFPLGNGRMGAMVFGTVNRERIQLNEETLWMGGPRETDNP